MAEPNHGLRAMTMTMKTALPKIPAANPAELAEEAEKPALTLAFDPARALLSAAQPSYVADLDGRIVYANPRYRALAEEVLGPAAAAVRPVENLNEVISMMIAGETEVVERGMRIPQIVDRYISARHFPIHDEAGNLIAVGGFYRESTRRVREWQDLEQGQERFNDITRLSSDMVWETDPNFDLVYVSPRVTEILGFHPREIIGRNLFALGAPEDGTGKFAPNMRSPFRDVAVAVTDRNSRVRPLRLSGLPMFDDSGVFRGYRGTATDVSAETEAREIATLSRERLTTAIENISEGFALYDGHNRLVLCNNRLREYLGSAHRVLFPGAPFHGILQALNEHGTIISTSTSSSAVDDWLGLRDRAEKDGEASIEIELSGGRWLRVTDRPTEDGGIVSIVSDITDAKGREETLLSAKELAEQGSRSKSEFLANMSHELRTPLNAIIGFSQVMRAETLGPVGSPRYIEYLDDIIDSSQHLLGVINDILDVAKSEAGKLDLKEQHVDIAEEVRLTTRLFGEQAAEANVHLVLKLPDTLPLLWADQRKIRQILLNLVSNAIKFTPPDGSVTVSAKVNRSGAMSLEVKDTGIGIEEQDIAAALAPFGQVESSLSRRYEGTGLGLPLTQALVERHGGKLRLQSRPGKGTRVTARFPRERVQAQAVNP